MIRLRPRSWGRFTLYQPCAMEHLKLIDTMCKAPEEDYLFLLLSYVDNENGEPLNSKSRIDDAVSGWKELVALEEAVYKYIMEEIEQWEFPLFFVPESAGYRPLKTNNVAPFIADLLANQYVKLDKLQTVHTLADVYIMYESLLVSKENERRAIAAAGKGV